MQKYTIYFGYFNDGLVNMMCPDYSNYGKSSTPSDENKEINPPSGKNYDGYPVRVDLEPSTTNQKAKHHALLKDSNLKNIK